MERIEQEYGLMIHKMARQYSPSGVDPRDTYVDVLIMVADRVSKGRVRIEDQPAMMNTIRQRAIEQCRREKTYSDRFETVENICSVVDDNKRSNGSVLTYHQRVAEIKGRIRKVLPGIDARIVCELVYPSARTQRYADRKPYKRARRPAEANGNFRATVRRWHIAEIMGVSMGRVAEAMRRARDNVEVILGRGEDG